MSIDVTLLVETISTLEARVNLLEAEVAAPRARLSTDSTNSHKPPSIASMMSVVQSLRAQGRDGFAFLRDLLTPGLQTPSLLPTPS